MIFIKGKGYRNLIRRQLVRLIKWVFPVGSFYDTPRSYENFFYWIPQNPSQGELVLISNSQNRIEEPPEIFNHVLSKRFSRYFHREIPPSYVVKLYKGIVLGNQTNLILSVNGILSADLSREFGAYGGKPVQQISLLSELLKMPPVNFLKGKVAVISTQGCRNFHHWLYDSIPRIWLLNKSGIIDKIDYFLIATNKQQFQNESLRLLDIPESKIINTMDGLSNFQADELFVPSLPSPLGSVSPWVIDFLRNLFNPYNEKKEGYKKIFISRKNVKTRHVVNNNEFMRCLSSFDIKTVFPEDFSVTDFAKIIAGADFIISVHGSGLSNLCFLNPGTVVVDILAPYHQDAYYWQISNICKSSYIGIFSYGSHPDDDLDLVKHKIDDDLLIDIASLTELLIQKL